MLKAAISAPYSASLQRPTSITDQIARCRQAATHFSCDATDAECPRKAIGILNNPLYIGRIVWNRSQKVRDPYAGRCVTRQRPDNEWVWSEAGDLRIVPDDLWSRVQARREAQRWAGQALADHRICPPRSLGGLSSGSACRWTRLLPSSGTACTSPASRRKRISKTLVMSAGWGRK